MTASYQNSFPANLFRRHRGQYDPLGRRAHPHGPARSTGDDDVSRPSAPSRAGPRVRHGPRPGVLHTCRSRRRWANLCCCRCPRNDVPATTCAASPSQPGLPPATVAPDLSRRLAGIPDVAAGDSVSVALRLIHSVAPVQDSSGLGHGMYIPAAPWCPGSTSLPETPRAS